MAGQRRIHGLVRDRAEEVEPSEQGDSVDAKGLRHDMDQWQEQEDRKQRDLGDSRGSREARKETLKAGSHKSTNSRKYFAFI